MQKHKYLFKLKVIFSLKKSVKNALKVNLKILATISLHLRNRILQNDAKANNFLFLIVELN